MATATLAAPLSATHKQWAMLARDIVLPVAIFLAFLPFPQQWITYAFVMIAFGHINLAILYQYRAGKVTPRYLFIAIGLLLVGIAYFVWYGDPLVIYFLTVVTFGLHGAVDEFYLHGEQLNWWKATTVLAFIAFFAASSLRPYSIQFDIIPPLAAGFALIVTIVRYMLTRTLPSRTELYLWFIAILLATFLHGAGVYTALGVMSLLHFINWYIAYALKLQGTERAPRYYKEVAVLTVLGVSLFCLYQFAGIEWLGFLFNPVYYAAWAVWHFILSSRFVSGEKKPLGL